MSFDATLRRHLRVVNLALIAVAAYFQAAGMGQVASWLLTPPGGWRAGGWDAGRAPPQVSPDDHQTSARAILDRNPFDSKTPRPLDALAEADAGPSSGPTRCEGFKALI